MQHAIASNSLIIFGSRELICHIFLSLLVSYSCKFKCFGDVIRKSMSLSSNTKHIAVNPYRAVPVSK